MKTIFSLFILFSSLCLSAQSEFLFNKNITSLKVATGIEVELIIGAEQNKIIGDQEVLEAINFKVRNGELKLSLPIGKLIEGNVPLSVQVFTKEIDQLNVVQGANVEIISLVNLPQFLIRASEGAEVSGEFDTTLLTLKSISGAIIDIRGKTEKIDVLANTGGIIKGRNLVSQNAIVKVTYGGTASIFTSESCDADIVAGGTINIYGNPKFMNKKTNFGGDINIFNLQ